MQQEIDPNTFTQKDLMQHLLQASQHAVTREEMTAQFRQAEQQNKERFEQVAKRFEQAEQQNKERFEQVEKRFEQVEKRFEQVDNQLERQHQALMGMGQDIKDVHQDIKYQMRWSLGILISVGGLVLGILKFTGI